MLAQDRYNLLTKTLLEKKAISISEAVALCNMSFETARLDLEVLQKMGIAKRVHGGAVLKMEDETQSHGAGSSVSHIKYPTNYKNPLNKVCAKKATELVKPGDVIYVGHGSTMAYFASYLKDVDNLTVITPSLYAINKLNGAKATTICLGGELDLDESFFFGNLTEESFKTYNYTKTFISCGGLSITNGYITGYDMREINYKLLRAHSEKIYLILNHEKIHLHAPINYGDLNLIDGIIVDDMIAPEDVKALEDKGITVYLGPMLDSYAFNTQSDK